MSGLTQTLNSTIHHEPGLLLYLKDRVTNGVDIARLGTIPHGDSLLALGRSEAPTPGAPRIPEMSALPIGVRDPNPDTSAYLLPYKHFIDHPFMKVEDPPFPGFSPKNATALLRDFFPRFATPVQTTKFEFSTKLETAGIVNIPFVVNQANATEMVSTFWITECQEPGPDGDPMLIMQYAQIVMLDFFDRTDGQPGLIKWPHISINTMMRVAKEVQSAALTSAAVRTMIV